ncbi:MAG: hypothetical protein QM689_11900 [Oscillospiraceae bacterium]
MMPAVVVYGPEAERLVLAACALLLIGAVIVGGWAFSGKKVSVSTHRLNKGRAQVQRAFTQALGVQATEMNLNDFTLVVGCSVEAQRKRSGKRMHYVYSFYIYGFNRTSTALDSYAAEIRFRHGRLQPVSLIPLNAETVSRVEVRFLRTYIAFFGKNGRERLRFSVPPMNSRDFAVGCPVNLDQMLEAEEFYDYIERFADNGGQ